MNDENKTPLTHRVTAVAAAYLDGGGFKPVETEVDVAPHWIADIASFVYPSMTEAKNLKLISRVKHSDADQLYGELRYRYNFPLTAVVEVKTSVGDYKKDLSTKFDGRIFPAHLCYLAYPHGMIDKEAIPEGWIGLETTGEGDRVRKVHTGKAWHLHHQKPGDVTDLIARVAIRRDHRTRYAAIKAFVKAHKSERAAIDRQSKTAHILETLISWLKNEGFYKDYMLEELFASHRFKVPKYLETHIKHFESLRLK